MKETLASLLLLCALASNALAPRRTSQAAVLGGDLARVHDPSRILKCNGKYFLYHTGENVPMRFSTDLIHWQKGPPALEKVPDWARAAVPGAKGNFIWAPDVIFVDGKYLLFWSLSTFGSRVSVTGLLTSPTLDPDAPDYKWTDQGPVLATQDSSDYNAIDAAPILTRAGELWLAIGSWQRNGIKLTRLDRKTGKPVGPLTTVAAGQRTGPEAAYLYERGGWFYLFENEGDCCRGMGSTYNIRVGRSKGIGGPYLDKDGRDLARGGGTLFAGTDGAFIGPGHVGITDDGGIERLTFHYYNGLANGTPTLGMRTLAWSADGWPSMAPELEPGRYSITSRASGLALGVAGNSRDDGAAIDQFEYRGGATQQWNVSPTGDGALSIGSIGTGKYLQAGPDGAAVTQAAWKNSGRANDGASTASQQWRAEPLGDGSFRIVAAGTGTNQGAVLTLPGGEGEKKPLAQVNASPWKGEDGQKWLFKKLP